MSNFYQFQYLLFFFLLLNFIFLLGNLIFALFEQQDDLVSKKVFFKLIYGVLLIVFLTSIFFSKFNTIHLAMIFPLYFLLKQKKISKSFKLILNRKEFILINLFSIVILFFQHLFFSKFGVLNLLPFDLNNHAQLTYFMGELGFESKFAELNSLNALRVPERTPYHYTDLWLNVFFVKILPFVKSGYSLIYLTYPILFTIYFSGLYMLSKLFIRNNYIVFFICILGLFVGPLDLIFFREIFFEGNLFETKTVIFENIGFFFNTILYSYNGQKHIPIYLLSIIILCFFLKNDIKKMLIALSIAPILNIGTLPAVFGATTLFLIFQYYKSREIKNLILMAMPLLFVTFFIIIYYKINGGYDVENQTDILILNNELNFKGIVLKIGLRLIYTLLFLFLLYIPFLIIIFKFKKDFFKNNGYFFVLYLIVSAVVTRFFLEGFNTAQFLTVILPIVNVFVFFMFVKYYTQNKKMVIGLMIVMFIVNFNSTKYHTQTRRDIDVFHNYSKTFVYSVFKILAKDHEPKIGYLLGEKVFKANKPGFWYGFYPCEFLLLNDYFNFYSLNFPNYIYSKNSTNSNDFSPNHLRYFMGHNLSEKQYEYQLIPFVKKQNIKYLVCSKDSRIPLIIQLNISDSIIDSKSGDRFYTLNQ